MFKSKQQILHEDDQMEGWARTCVYELIINTNLNKSQITELFTNAFPEYEHIMHEVFEAEEI